MKNVDLRVEYMVHRRVQMSFIQSLFLNYAIVFHLIVSIFLDFYILKEEKERPKKGNPYCLFWNKLISIFNWLICLELNLVKSTWLL